MPVACSPEIVRLHIELFPRPTWEDSKLAGLEVAGTSGACHGIGHSFASLVPHLLIYQL